MMNVKCCPKCGYIDSVPILEPVTCRYCGFTLITTEFDYLEFAKLCKDDEESANKIIEDKYVTGNPEFSEEAKQERLKKKAWEDAHRPIDRPLESNTVKCPYCKSTNVKKISTANRAVSVGLFGLASKKIGKQWHCNKCKSDF